MEAGPEEPASTHLEKTGTALPRLCIAKLEIPARACVLIALDLFQHCRNLGTVCRNKCPWPFYLQFSLQGGGNLSTLGIPHILPLLPVFFCDSWAVGFPPELPCVSSCSRCAGSFVRGKSTQFLDISHLFTKLCTHRGMLSWGAINPQCRGGSQWWD